MQKYVIKSGKYALATLGLTSIICILININFNKQLVANNNIALPDGNTVAISTSLPIPKSFIGIKLTELTNEISQNLKFPDQNGVYIQDIIRNSPGQNAGLLPGDIIIKINKVDVQNVTSAMQLLYSLLPGTTFSLEIFRQSQYLEFLIIPQALFLTQQSNAAENSDKESSVN